MIYLVYPLLLLALLWGCHVSKKKEFNEDAFSLSQMKAMQGFAAVCIMLHHCGQKTSASWIDKKYYVPGLGFFVPIGFILVSLFTFCSGYGLYKSFKNKEGYLKNRFILKRIVPIVLLHYAVTFIFLGVRFALGEKIKGAKLLWYVTSLKLCNPNSWFVIVIPFFYLCFYLAFRFIKNEKIALLAVLLFTMSYQFLGASIDHNDWWMRGEWWYNSIHLFVVGIFFAKHEEKILAHIKNHYVLYLILGIVMILITYGFSEFAKGFFSYYGENFNAPDKVFRRLICLSGEVLLSSSVVFTAFMIGLKIRIGNGFLNMMGKITLEFYLIHGLYVELFSYAFDGKLKSLYYIKNSALFVLVVFALGLPSALIIKKTEDLVRRKSTAHKA